MTKLELFQKALKEGGHEGAIISSELNQRYLSGFSFTDGYLFITPDDAYLLTDTRYIEAARNAVKNFNITLGKGGMLETLKNLAKEKKLQGIIIEEHELSLGDYKYLSEKMESCKLCEGASKILSELRMVKTPDEIEKAREAQKITDMAFSHILNYISRERTETDVALELEFFMRRHGAESIAFETIAVSGPASSLPHGTPSDIPLREGFLTMDFGAKFEGYCADMTRTVVIGKADEEMKRLYNTVLSAQLNALANMKGGVSCADADEFARSVIREAGYGEYFGHSLGHGVGMFIHENPSVSPKADPKSILRPGHIVTVEPGIYIEGKYGCRIEDMVTILEDGSLYDFTQSPKELIEL